jgi:hypothetical protein
LVTEESGKRFGGQTYNGAGCDVERPMRAFRNSGDTNRDRGCAGGACGFGKIARESPGRGDSARGVARGKRLFRFMI